MNACEKHCTLSRKLNQHSISVGEYNQEQGFKKEEFVLENSRDLREICSISEVRTDTFPSSFSIYHVRDIKQSCTKFIYFE